MAGVSPPILGFHDVDFNYPGGPTLFKDLNFGLVSQARERAPGGGAPAGGHVSEAVFLSKRNGLHGNVCVWGGGGGV
jgi:hypothetical protein